MRNEADMVSKPEKNRTDESGFSVDESWVLAPGRFQHKKFWKTIGAGVVLILSGTFLIASVKDVPKAIAGSTYLMDFQRITDVLPNTTKELIEFALGNLLLLSGVYCIFLSLKILVRFTSGRRG